MNFTLIAAIGKNGALGKDNQLLWHLPDDLKRFKKLTLNQNLIMGRKTFESLPGLLPNREHIVLSSHLKTKEERVFVAHTVDQAIETAEKAANKTFIIGGAQIYRLFLPFCDTLEITKVDASPEADTFFPAIDWQEWDTVYYQKHPADDKHAHAFTFVTYRRK